MDINQTGRRYVPPAKRRMMEAEESDDEMAEVEGDEMVDPMAEGSVGAAMPKLSAPKELLGSAKAGDVVTFKVVSIDPETGAGTLESATTEEM